MAVKTFYLAAGNDGNYAALSETAQAAANRTDGWTVGKTASVRSSYYSATAKQGTGTFSDQTTLPKPSPPMGNLDCFKAPAALTGVFAATAWTFTFAVRATVASAQTGRILMRVYKTTNAAGGSGATQITSAALVGTTTAALSTTADGVSTVTWNPGAITLSNEYLFFELAWEIVVASGNNSGDVVFRTGATGPAGTRVVTPDLSTSTPQNVTVSGCGSAQAFGTVSAVLVPTTYAERVLFDGARFYWRLGESAGTTAVDAVGTLNGAYTNAPLLGQAGALSSDAPNTSVDFTGTGKWVDVPANTLHQNIPVFTAEAWIYPTAGVTTDTAIICHNYTGASMSLVLGYGTGGSLEFEDDPLPEQLAAGQQRFWGGFFVGGVGWKRVYDPTDLPLNAWTHIATTYDGTTVRVYRNGVETATLAATGWGAASASQTLRVAIRWDGSAGTPSFPGRIDEVAVYPTALSPAGILAHYTIGTAAPPPPQNAPVSGVTPSGVGASYSNEVLADTPLVYYRLGEASGTGVVDSSGNARNGVYNGTPALGQAGAVVGSTAVLFDGVDDWVDLPTSLSLPADSSITVEWWQNLATGDVRFSSAFTIGLSSDPNRCTAHAPYTDNVLYWDYGHVTGGRVSTSYAAYLNKWTLIQLTFDAATNTHAISLDGVEVASAVNAISPVASLVGGQIASGVVGASFYHKGLVDEFAVYDKALAPDRKLAHYNAKSATFTQFGTPTAAITVPAQPVPVSGLSSAASFGTLIIKTAVSKPAGGVASAQAFGTVTRTTTVTRQVGAVSSAQSFGTLTFKLFRPAGGVTTAQSFGAPTIKTVVTRAVTGLSTAQSFGTVTIRTAVSKPSAGVGSAQAFGAPAVTVKGPPQTVQVAGFNPSTYVPSIVGEAITGDGHVVGGTGADTRFGVVTIQTGSVFPSTVAINGIGSAQTLGSLKFRVTLGSGGVLTAQAFGVPTIKTAVSRTVTGLGTAQTFGAVTVLRGPVTKPAGGVGTAQAFGVPNVTGLAIPPQTVPVNGVQPSGAGLTFNPGSITGFAGWYDASQLALADGALVNPWPDLSGTNHGLSATDGPTHAPVFKTNVLNGLPVVRFDGVDDVVRVTNVVAVAYQHLFVVAKYRLPTFTSYDGLLSCAATYILIGTAGGTWFYSPPGIYELRRNGVVDNADRTGPMEAWANIGVSFDAPLAADYFLIGLDRSYPPRYWDGDVAEVLCYDRKLSDVERVQVENYLSGKWLGAGAPASQFGVPAVSITSIPAQQVAVAGVATAVAFGTPTTKQLTRVTVGSVATAQQFGTVTTKAVTRVAVTGLGTAQQFGFLTPTKGSPQTVQVAGLPQPVGMPSIVGHVISGDGHVVGGSGLLFGFVTIVPGRVFTTPFPGIPSAQQFGAVWITFPQTITVGGVASAARFGTTIAFIVWVRPITCTDLALAVSSCTDVTFTASSSVEVVLTAVAVATLDLAPSSAEELDLQPVGCD